MTVSNSSIEAIIRSPLGEIRVWLDDTPETDAGSANAVRTTVRMDYADDPAMGMARIGLVTARLNEVLRGLNGGRPAAENSHRANVALWIADRIATEAMARTPAATLYADYTLWCERRSARPVNQAVFGTEMTQRGFPVAGKDNTGRKYRGGLRLRPSDASPALVAV